MGRNMWRALVCVLALSVATSAFAQTTSISGVVKDSAGGVIPGATVVVKNNATGTTSEAVTNSTGAYVVPGMQAGLYTVTATLTGFKTAQSNDVRVGVGVAATVNLTLEVGNLTETVNVTSSTELINTQTATVTATLNSDQLNRMPTPTRNALNAVAFLPGVNTTGTNRDSTINGLPDSFVQITMDGASNNDNFLRSSDGFFASVTPRQDAVEAVTVTMAAAGANLGGSGAVTIAFQTRSGGQRFTGSLYEYFRHPALNTNYIFNRINGLPKNDVKLHQYGGRVGGPIVIPGLYDGRGKAFFFVNYEQIRFPNNFTRTRTVMPSAFIDGNFTYEIANGGRATVNILTLAAKLGQLATIDPTTVALLRRIDAAVASTGVRNPTANPTNDSYVYQSPSKLFEHQPTARFDYNITDKHRLTLTGAVLQATRDADYLNGGDANFPGAPNYSKFTSVRPLYTATVRSTLSQNVVNEFRGNITALGGTSYFGSMSSNGPDSFADQDGYRLILPGDWTDWTVQNGPSWRSAPTYLIGNTLSWQRSSHSFSFGAEWQRATAKESAQTMVPTISLGFSTDFDPAASMFTAANFPGISSGDLGDARDLYAALTGRVSNVSGQAVLNASTGKYELFQPRTRAGYMDTFSGFVQDSWRMTPTITVTAGLRYDLQMPFTPSNDIMTTMTMEDACGMSGLGDGSVFNRCNFFKPGFNSGNVGAELYVLTKGTRGYDTDYNNLSPSLSIAWRPNVQSGFLRSILGDPDQATVRAGYSMSTAREGLSAFTGVFGVNRGSTLALSRTAGNGLLVPAGSGTWPVLFSQRSRLGQAPFPETPTFPIQMAGNRAESVELYAPGFRVGRGQTWTAGIQRAIGSDMAVEVRYLGTKGSDQRSDLQYNAINGDTVVNNGVFEEFKLAVANLKANNVAGGTRAGSFAYFGANSGTSPLPITLGHLNGRTDATNAAAYTGGSNTWSSTNITNNLNQNNPSPTGMAGQLVNSSARRANGIAAGYPANLLLTNPYLNNVRVWDSGAFSDYHALQVELRRRLSKGLSASGSYQYAIERGSAFDGFSFGRTMVNGAAVRHAIKGQWDWTLPVGRGQRFGANMHPVIDAALGGWSLNGVFRVQARVVNFGNVRLVGMTLDELTSMYKYYERTNATTGNREFYMLPLDVILNTRRAFSTSPTTANGYSSTLGVPEGRYIAPANSSTCTQIVAGDCAPRSTLVRAPWFSKVDMGVTKRFNIRGTMNLEVRADVLNVFDAINLNPVANPGSGATIFTVSSGYTDPSNTYDPGGRIGQLMMRFNW